MVEYFEGKVPEFKTKRGRKHKESKKWYENIDKYKDFRKKSQSL